jgi:dimethylargininase
MAVAVIREVTDSFSRCVTRRPPVPPLDPDLARRQHAAYRAALEDGGFSSRAVAGDEAHPDGCFIEDAAVVIGDVALIANSGHPSRRGEAGPVAAALAGLVEIEHMGEGTLDGGDVLQVGTTVFVGVGGRTDAVGASRLDDVCRHTGRRIVAVPTGALLHLKSGATALDEHTVLWHPSTGHRGAFAGLRVVEVPGDDPEAANVVRLADGRVLCAASHPATADLVASLGYGVVTCDVSEFGRADGGLTCLSIRIR